MKASREIDRQTAERILKYIDDLARIFRSENIETYQCLKDSLSAKYASTQLLTNIYELTKLMRGETLSNMKNFYTPELRRTRNVASHDYSAVDFRSVHFLCVTLMGKKVREELGRLANGD